MPKNKRKQRTRRSNSKSGIFGVDRLPNGRYRAKICINRKIKYLGSSYKTAKQAAKAYDKEAVRLRRPLSKLNYPKKAPVGYAPIQKPLHSNNTVGYRGVTKERNGKFNAGIKVGGKQKYIGTYDTPKEAAIAYDRFILKNKQSTSSLNFPGMVHNLDVEPKRVRQICHNASGSFGVYLNRSGTFLARITIDGKTKSLGTFGTVDEAAVAYDRAAVSEANNKRSLNFPDRVWIFQATPSHPINGTIHVN